MGSKTSCWYSKFSWDEQATNLSSEYLKKIAFPIGLLLIFHPNSNSLDLFMSFIWFVGYFVSLKYKSLCSTTVLINILTRLALLSRCFENLHLDGWNAQSKLSQLPTIQGVLKHPICLISHPSIYTRISYHLIQYIFKHLPLQNIYVASFSQKNYGLPPYYTTHLPSIIFSSANLHA